jgi:hypothetical protein
MPIVIDTIRLLLQGAFVRALSPLVTSSLHRLIYFTKRANKREREKKQTNTQGEKTKEREEQQGKSEMEECGMN